MYVNRWLWIAAIFLTVWMALVAFAVVQVSAQEASLRAQFFKDAKKAQLVGGKPGEVFNCCEPAEAAGIVITGGDATHLRAKIIRHFRDKSRKLGTLIEIRKSRIAIWPIPPAEMGNVAFVSSHGGNFVYCAFFQPGG